MQYFLSKVQRGVRLLLVNSLPTASLVSLESFFCKFWAWVSGWLKRFSARLWVFRAESGIQLFSIGAFTGSCRRKNSAVTEPPPWFLIWAYSGRVSWS